jgi:hypothetical protein
MAEWSPVVPPKRSHHPVPPTFQLFFTPPEMETELMQAGFRRLEQRDREQLSAMYFRDREDGLKLPGEGSGMMTTGWTGSWTED